MKISTFEEHSLRISQLFIIILQFKDNGKQYDALQQVYQTLRKTKIVLLLVFNTNFHSLSKDYRMYNST